MAEGQLIPCIVLSRTTAVKLAYRKLEKKATGVATGFVSVAPADRISLRTAQPHQRNKNCLQGTYIYKPLYSLIF